MDKIQRKLDSIGDAIREKTGKEELLSLDEMPNEILSIETGIKTDDATAVAEDILSGKTAYVKDVKITGTIPTKAATTIIPTKSEQTAVASGVYITGAIKVAAIPDEYAELNFEVVGGTTRPSNVSENTIWVNTSTEITSWVFSITEPTEPVAGMTWFSTGMYSNTEFNALKKNAIQINPITTYQYISGVWTQVATAIYQGGSWTSMTVAAIEIYSGGVLSSEYTNSGSTVSVGTSAITVYSKVWGYGGTFKVIFSEKFDPTVYEKATIKYTQTCTDASWLVHCLAAFDDSGNAIASIELGGTVSSQTSKSLNLSTITGVTSCRIGLYAYKKKIYANENYSAVTTNIVELVVE